ncbi:hypothetical protein GCM10010123_27450 [Pilimelia anulata]|uniref:Secreted protein n=1 Tax=Pilimelia anulata TaxID=53371 RepID=A0A8J3B504_9ACTN|nr:hypothetical protein GCM10010123_27450 [Pilimelia anulata]
MPWLVCAAVLGAVLYGLAWLAGRVRRRGGGSELMGPVDLIYRPHAHLLHAEIRQHEQRRIPLPAPNDPHRPTPPH